MLRPNAQGEFSLVLQVLGVGQGMIPVLAPPRGPLAGCDIIMSDQSEGIRRVSLTVRPPQAMSNVISLPRNTSNGNVSH